MSTNHINTCYVCAASTVAHAFLRFTTNLTVLFFQFCSHWINKHILIVIILNEDDTIFRATFFSTFASILIFSCSGLKDFGKHTVQVRRTRLMDNLSYSRVKYLLTETQPTKT